MVPTIDAFRCDGCAICVKRCPPQIMGLVKNRATILTDFCEECGICAEVCPISAVRFRLIHHDYDSKHDGYHVKPR